MTFVTFLIGIIILVFLSRLNHRVGKLEKMVSSTNTNTQRVNEKLVDNIEKQTPQTTQISKPLIDYIKEQISQGYSTDNIKNILIGNGWKLDNIEQAFKFVETSSDNLSIISTEQIKKTQPAEPVLFNRFTSWIKEDWLLKLGGLLLIIGFGWLTTYAFLNNWVGPMGRITLGIIAGALFILFGYIRVKKYLHQGGVFLILGSTIILLTVFAGREFYGFFTPISALAIMFLSTALVALVSVKYDSRSIAISSLILAGVSPLLVHISLLSNIWLFSYLFVVVLGTVWITFLTGRRELTAIALITVFAYSLPYLVFPSQDSATLLFFIYAFSILFFLTSTIGLLKSKSKEIMPDLFTASGNGLLLLVWIMTNATEEWKSLIILAWMVVFAVGAFLIFKATNRKEPFYIYLGVGVAMLAAATAVELNGSALIIAYTIESGLIPLIAYLILKDIKITEQTCWLFLGPVILSVESLNSRAWNDGVFHKDFFVLLLLGVILFILGLFFWNQNKVQTLASNKAEVHTVLIIGGSVYIYVLLWLSLHAGIVNNDIAVMIALLVYTVIGLATYFYGFTQNHKGIRLYGSVLLGFVVGRLLLVDVWKMAISGRIITFFGIGALLISTAFFGKYKKNPNLIDK